MCKVCEGTKLVACWPSAGHALPCTAGEDVKKLDILSNENFINCLRFSTKASVLVSEEDEDPIVLTNASHAKYAVVFDPLDGSSNIDCNVSVGSIFGIYKRQDASQPVSVQDVLQPGTELVAAGYCMYGSSTQMVLTIAGTDSGVSIFTLDPSIGEFILTTRNVTIPAQPKKIYSVNEGNWKSFPAPVQEYIKQVKTADKPYSLRYVGSMVADVHRTLVYGGIFMYPATASSPNGKLRLLYEGNPMSMLIEAAGGKASTGTGRVMDIVPTGIHERCPIFLGTAAEVERVEALYAAEAAGGAKRAREE